MNVAAEIKTLWEYHLMNQKIEKADCILALGSHDVLTGETGARLFLDGWAPFLIFSGGLGRLTEGVWNRTEAERFADIAVNMGVPQDRIIIENRSTNTGENILFTKRLLEDMNMDFNKFIVVQKPYMERRAFATFKKLWPEKEVIVTSAQMDFECYCSHLKNEVSMDEIISIMVGDLQRIKVYPEKGYQIPQEIPIEVWSAFESLVRTGYNKYLIERV